MAIQWNFGNLTTQGTRQIVRNVDISNHREKYIT